MRPKKVILCVDSDESDLSLLRLVLWTNGYIAVPASTDAEARHIFNRGDRPIELVLVAHRDDLDGIALVAELKAVRSSVPMILLCPPDTAARELCVADAILDRRSCSAAALLERIKVMSARKRGPRKGNPCAEAAHRAAPVPEEA
jgi:DNA-binding response OmpR family regulator